ncbi:hypothetical protein N9A78_00960, partial [Akkermansiaceae bacterium]|nr:hypothetical protein [Akkermansiaceae bacterium]
GGGGDLPIPNSPTYLTESHNPKQTLVAVRCRPASTCSVFSIYGVGGNSHGSQKLIWLAAISDALCLRIYGPPHQRNTNACAQLELGRLLDLSIDVCQVHGAQQVDNMSSQYGQIFHAAQIGWTSCFIYFCRVGAWKSKPNSRAQDYNNSDLVFAVNCFDRLTNDIAFSQSSHFLTQQFYYGNGSHSSKTMPKSTPSYKMESCYTPP